jgi:hypothetical protein
MNHNKKTYYLLLLTLLPAFAWQTWSFAAAQSIPPAQIASSLNEQATDALDIVAHHADQLDPTRAKKIAAIFEKENEALGKQINATQKTNVEFNQAPQVNDTHLYVLSPRGFLYIFEKQTDEQV